MTEKCKSPIYLEDYTEVFCDQPKGHQGNHRSGEDIEWGQSYFERRCCAEVYRPQGLIGICRMKRGHRTPCHEIKGKYGTRRYPINGGNC